MGMFSCDILCMLPLACVLLTRSSDGKTLEEKVCYKSADCGMFRDVIIICDARINRCATYQVHYDELSHSQLLVKADKPEVYWLQLQLHDIFQYIFITSLVCSGLALQCS